MDEDFLHSLNSSNDSEEPDLEMDWQQMKSLLDKEMPVVPPFVAKPPNTSLWLKSLIVAALIGTICFMAFLWNVHNKKELNDKKTAEINILKLSKKPVHNTENANENTNLLDSLSGKNIVSDSSVYATNDSGLNSKTNLSEINPTVQTNSSLENLRNKKNKETVSNNNKAVIQNKVGANIKTTADTVIKSDISFGQHLNKSNKKQSRNKNTNGDLNDSGINMPINKNDKKNADKFFNNKTNSPQNIADTSFKLSAKSWANNKKQPVNILVDTHQNQTVINNKPNKNKITEKNTNAQPDNNTTNFIGLNNNGNIKIIENKVGLTQNEQPNKTNSFDSPNNNINSIIDQSNNTQSNKPQAKNEISTNGQVDKHIAQTTNATDNKAQIKGQQDLNNALSSNKTDSNNNIKNLISGIKKDTAISDTKLSNPKNKTKKSSKSNGDIDWGFYVGTQQHFATGGQSNDNYGLNGSSNPLQNYIPSFAFVVAKYKWSLGLQTAILQPGYLKHQTIKNLDTTAAGPTLAKLFQSPVSLQLGYKVFSNIKIFTGAGISFNQKAILITPPDSLGNYNIKSIKGKDFSGYGLKQTNPFWTIGFDYQFKRFVVGMQYTQGFGTFVDYNNISQKPHDIQLFLRYELFKKKKK